MKISNRVLKELYNSGVARSAFKYYVGLWTTVTSRFPVGTNVYDQKWDTLIILDTCRVDALGVVKSEYEFLDGIGSILSVGSTSNEWMANTFIDKYEGEVSETTYVSANGYSSRVFEERQYPEVHMGGKHHPPSWPKDHICHPEDFHNLDQLWRYAPQDNPGHTLPEYVVDRGVSHGRANDAKRLILHFNQPHAPYIGNALDEERELYEYEESPFEALRSGEEKSKVWNAYLDNLRMVLDEVEVFLENHDADTVAITADHGEAFGEWGMYGHLPGMIHPHVKLVPWTTTSSKDTGKHTPKLEPEKTDRDTEAHLEALGYK